MLTDSFWKPTLETDKGKGSTSAAAETVDEEESSEESSKEAAAAGLASRGGQKRNRAKPSNRHVHILY